MADPTTPEQQASGSAQQVEDYKPRFDGAVRKIEELTMASRASATELATKASEIEQLRAQLGLKDAEKTVAISEREKQLQLSVQSNTAKDTELNELRALKLKVKVIRELGDPSLLKIADRLPNLTDEEALKSVLLDFSNYAKDAASERERQIMSGMSPAGGGSQTASAALPTSDADWSKHIDGLPMGSPERLKAQDAWWDWGMKNHK